MARDYTITAPDGSDLVINGPDDATPQQLRAAAEQAFKISGGTPSPAAPPPPAAPQMGSRQRAQIQSANLLGDSVAGFLPGVARAFNGVVQNVSDAARKVLPDLPVYQQQGQQLADVNSNMDAGHAGVPGYGLGKFVGDVAITAPVGGAIAAPARALVGAGVLPKVAEPVINAIASSGMKTGANPTTLVAKVGDLAARSVGGAVSGGASSALVDPSSIGVGATVGAMLPPALKSIGAAASAAGRLAETGATEIANALRSDASKGAAELAKALDLTPDQLPGVIARLRGTNALVDGSTPTVAQALSKPQASILERIVSAGPGGEKLREALAAQSEARLNALGSVAPIAPNGPAQMNADTGIAIGRFANAEGAQARSAGQGLWQAIDPNGAERIPLPVEQMQGAVDRYLGPGAFGRNMDAATASRTTAGLSGDVPGTQASRILGPDGRPAISAGGPTQRAATWDEVGRLKSSLGDAWSQAVEKGQTQSAAALAAQLASLDDAIRGGLSSLALARWTEANASHAALMDRFHSGPQASIFRTLNGEPAKEGGEITSLFWGGRPGLAEDVQSFKKLIGDNPALLGQFKSMVTTEGAATAAQGQVLGQKFVDWTKGRLPGLREVFTPQEVQALQNIASDLERSAAASKLGIGPGSNTYQNASNALDAGLLGSPLAKAVAGRVPFVRGILEPLRAAGAESASKAKGNRLAALLSDSEGAANALTTLLPSPVGRRANALMDLGDNAWRAKIPGVELTVNELLRLGAYKGTPLISAQ